MTKEELEQLGYIYVRQLPSGMWLGISQQIYTFGLCVGLHEIGYIGRYCYPRIMDAIRAIKTYTGVGDPDGNWIKYKGEDGERLNPHADLSEL